MIIIKCLKMYYKYRNKILKKIMILIKHLIDRNLHKKIYYNNKKDINLILH